MFAASPVVLSHPTNLSTRLGDEDKFVCTVEGTPTPSVLWQHDGVNVDFAVTESMEMSKLIH